MPQELNLIAIVCCRLTVTEKLGDKIAEHCKGKNRTYLDMAETIYRSCLAHYKVVNMMVRQGLYQRALDYAKDKGFTTRDYMDLLTAYPTYQLGYAICEMKDETEVSVIPAGMIARFVVDACHVYYYLFVMYVNAEKFLCCMY